MTLSKFGLGSYAGKRPDEVTWKGLVRRELQESKNILGAFGPGESRAPLKIPRGGSSGGHRVRLGVMSPPNQTQTINTTMHGDHRGQHEDVPPYGGGVGFVWFCVVLVWFLHSHDVSHIMTISRGGGLHDTKASSSLAVEHCTTEARAPRSRGSAAPDSAGKEDEEALLPEPDTSDFKPLGLKGVVGEEAPPILSVTRETSDGFMDSRRLAKKRLSTNEDTDSEQDESEEGEDDEEESEEDVLFMQKEKSSTQSKTNAFRGFGQLAVNALTFGATTGKKLNLGDDNFLGGDPRTKKKRKKKKKFGKGLIGSLLAGEPDESMSWRCPRGNVLCNGSAGLVDSTTREVAC